MIHIQAFHLSFSIPNNLSQINVKVSTVSNFFLTLVDYQDAVDLKTIQNDEYLQGQDNCF